MSRLATFRADLFNAVTHLCGYDIFIQDADHPWISPFKFTRICHGDSGTEFVWLGYHVTASSMDYIEQRRIKLTAEPS